MQVTPTIENKQACSHAYCNAVRTMCLMTTFIYLASQSPRRGQLLQQLGVHYEVLLPNDGLDTVEDTESIEAVLAGELACDYVQRVTALKLDAAVARHARRGLPAAPILCADTTVALDGDILGKPENAAHAHAMLQRLSARTHNVLTAVALQAGERRLHALSISQVRWMPMTTQQIAAYVASGEPFGKAGAYGIQGLAAAYITHMEGSYSGIMGLPAFETAQLLRGIGWHI